MRNSKNTDPFGKIAFEIQSKDKKNRKKLLIQWSCFLFLLTALLFNHFLSSQFQPREYHSYILQNLHREKVLHLLAEHPEGIVIHDEILGLTDTISSIVGFQLMVDALGISLEKDESSVKVVW